MKQAALGFLLAVVCFPLAAQNPYEVVVGGPHGGCAFEAMTFGVEWYGASGHLATSYGYVVAAAPGGRVYAAGVTDSVENFFEVHEIRPDTPSRRISQTIPAGPEWPEALVVDARGNMYVLMRDSVAPSYDQAIFAVNATGELRTRYPLGTADAMSMDLAADQCTMFIAGHSSGVRRLNVCTGVSLPDFAPVTARSVRVLPDGGVLLARGAGLERYTAGGSLLRTYPLAGDVIAMSLANGGSAVWLHQRCMRDVTELDLTSGSTRQILALDDEEPISLVPHSGWSAALNSFHNAAVPTASQLLLVALGFLLASFAMFRMR